MRRSDSALDFLLSRFLRIWPGLAVSLVVLVTLACTLFHGTADIHDALHYVLRNAIPFGPMYPAVGGVFVGNPAGAGFNASLWTLPIEVRMYRDVFVIWVFSFLFRRHRRFAFDILIVLAAAYFGARHLLLGDRVSVELAPDRLNYMFFVGAGALVLARRVRLDRIAVGVSLAAIVVSAVVSRTAFFFCYSTTLWYIIFGLAYLPRGRILQFNRLGDYSYGIYIYAWPVQQIAVTLWRQLTVFENILVTTPIIVACAVASWHWVERPALQLKRHWVRRTDVPRTS
jgi:peptidoglycan/LPS O-acetylase OafA/YrhL